MIDDLSVIIITFNEESNIRDCINSIKKVTNNIFVVDSYSTDRTQEILGEMGVKFVEHEFVNYSEKRNWAQKNNPFKTRWVFHLDADERFTPKLSEWLIKVFPVKKKEYDGFLFSRKTIFLNKWIKYGGQYPNYHSRLFKEQLGHCESKHYDQHWVVESKSITRIPGIDILNLVGKNLDEFILSHNNWASKEAKNILFSTPEQRGEVEARLFGNPIQKRRWLKQNIFEKFPLFLRSFLYFFYRYFIRLGFLDGKEGLIFFILQSFWFRFLVDAKVFEIKQIQSKK
tara:strand:- start:9318 stop:10172 length:855 start_codon:yes stop_codon:yes gene_type:complete